MYECHRCSHNLNHTILFPFAGTRRCPSDQMVKCRAAKKPLNDFVCVEKGDSVHPRDCTKFYRCAERNSHPCICRCRFKTLIWDTKSSQCKTQANEAPCRIPKRMGEKSEHTHKDIHGGLKKENDVIKSMFDSEEPKHKQVLKSQLSSLELNTFNLTSINAVIIDDDFPVWAISLAVSALVTLAVGIILYVYWKVAYSRNTTGRMLTVGQRVQSCSVGINLSSKSILSQQVGRLQRIWNRTENSSHENVISIKYHKTFPVNMFPGGIPCLNKWSDVSWELCSKVNPPSMAGGEETVMNVSPFAAEKDLVIRLQCQDTFPPPGHTKPTKVVNNPVREIACRVYEKIRIWGIKAGQNRE